MQILRPAILLAISFIAPLAWGAHSGELRDASRELDHAADTFYQTLEQRLGSGPALTEAERFADAAYQFALRVDSNEDPSVLWGDFQELVDGFDYLAREFEADNYARYQSHVSSDFYAVETAMNRVGNAFRDMPRYRQTFSYTYSTWPWYQHRFWAHYHYAPPVRYYQPHIYVGNYYSSGRRHGHIARYRGRQQQHRRNRHYVSPRKYVRQRHFSPNSRTRHANANRGQQRDNRANRNGRRNGPDARIQNNRNGNRQANQSRRGRTNNRNRQRDATRNRNAQRNDRRARNGQANTREGSNGRRSWTANNSAPAANNGNDRRRNSNNNARPSNSRLAPPPNRDARNNNRNQNRSTPRNSRPDNARRTGGSSQRNQPARARNAQRPAPAANNTRRQAQTRPNTRPSPRPNRTRNSTNNQNRGSNNQPTRRSKPAATRNSPRGGNRRARADRR
jgi:hypothetical protein